MRPTLDRTGTRVQFAAGGAHYSLAWDQDSAAPLGADAATLDLFATALAAAGMTAPDPYVAPPDGGNRPIVLWAGACVTVADGSVSDVPIGGNIAGVARLDVGLFWAFFASTLPDTAYMAMAYDDTGRRGSVEKGTDYLVVTMADQAGDPFDPATLNIEIKRAG